MMVRRISRSMARVEAVEGVVRWHENGDMAVGEPEVDDHERSGRGDQKQRAGGREVVGETKPRSFM